MTKKTLSLLDNIIGDDMKNFLIPIILAVLIGFFMAKLVFSQYETSELQTVFNESETVSMIQVGVYSSKESMEENTKDFAYYIYNLDQDMYYVYVGMTKNSSNLDKLKSYYQNLGYDIYIKEIKVDNEEFLSILDQYDNLLSKTEDQETIKTICSKVLQKYEELVK